MPILKFENLPSKKTPIPAEVLEALQRNLLEMVFPVGSIYRNENINMDPAEELGFGEWELHEGVVFPGASRTDEDFYIGVKAGEKKHAMTEAEMFRHSHGTMNVAGVQDGYTEGNYGFKSNGGPGRTEETGGSQPFNVCQPYYVPGFAWVRIA